ncbi:hypothetical protein M9458_051932 [Cirrhinus mrigala]|uniref:CRESS-DNA virus Rep endonuclease domain-containing protein n=1 Tax=Cirrhinus mrigala TaxID=683832 RepID=A0ABD0MQG2_CIRMR
MFSTSSLKRTVNMHTKRRMSTMKRWLSPRAHLEAALGSDLQNDEYCSKGGDIYLRIGAPSVERACNDLKRAIDVAKSSRGSPKAVAEACPTTFIRYGRGIRDYAWWDGYDGQDNVIIDDFYGWIAYDELLRVCDRYPCKVPVKGAFVEFVAKWEFVTRDNRSSGRAKRAQAKRQDPRRSASDPVTERNVVFYRANFEAARGTDLQTDEYCFKGNDIYLRTGKPSVECSRNDLQPAIDVARSSSGSLRAVAEACPATFLRYGRGIRDYVNVMQFRKPRDYKTQVMVLVGPPGCGKSRYASEMPPPTTSHLVPGGTATTATRTSLLMTFMAANHYEHIPQKVFQCEDKYRCPYNNIHHLHACQLMIKQNVEIYICL